MLCDKMGRKAKFDETKKVKKGPGRKARKQPDPVFRKELRKYYCFTLLDNVF